MDKIVVSCLESRIEENQSVYSRFLLGPFLGGHAVTVATALRRALLSEVKNIAITALHIQGVTHEFSTVVGIRESVLELSLNFQQIILSTQTKTKNVQVGYLHVQGPAIVHANDLKLPDGIECVNPTQYIATLSSEGLLVVKFLIYDKKSFLKSKTSTLNSKKIKEAKAYSARLSQSLLGHAEYDPSQLFRLLRNQNLPAYNQPTAEQGEVAQALQIEELQEEANHLRAATTQSRAYDQPTAEQGQFAANLRFASARTRAQNGLSTDSQSGEIGRHGQKRTDLEVPGLPDLRRDLTTVGTDSNLDQSTSLLSDEFNSEVCLRTIIPLEPIFTPVYQVNFGIERDDLSNQIRERIIMEVWTNGSIHPRQAINEAVLSTMSIFSKLRKTFHLDSHALALSANSAASLTNRLEPGDGFVPPGFARGRRFHKSKRTVKGGPLNDDVSEGVRLLAYSMPSSPVTAYAQKSERIEEQARSRLTKLDLTSALEPPSGLAQRSCARPRVTGTTFRQREAVHANRSSTRPKLNSLSSLEFVRSRHPVALFLQSFGKSHIRGQTFLLEQSSGLKAKFFKGHRAVLSKAKYTSEDFTFKTTFLPSFNVFLGPYGANLQYAPVTAKANLLNLDRPKAEQDRVRLTKAQLLFRLRFCLAGAVLRGVASQHLCSSNAPLRGALPKHEADPPPARLADNKPANALLTKPTVLYANPRLQTEGLQAAPIAERRGLQRRRGQSTTEQGAAPVCSGRLALALFGQVNPVLGRPLQVSTDEVDRSAYAPPTAEQGAPEGSILQQTGTAPAAGLFSARFSEQELRLLLSPRVDSLACTLATRRFAANLQFVTGEQVQLEELQAQQPKPKPILFLIKYRTFSFTRNALHIFGRKQEASSFLLPLTKQLIRLKMVLVLNSCLSLMSKRSEPSLRFRVNETQPFTTVEGLDLFDGKQVLLSLARSALDGSSMTCTQSKVGGSASSTTETETDSFVQAGLAQPIAEQRFGSQASRAILQGVPKRHSTCRPIAGQFDKFTRGGSRVLTLAQSKGEQAQSILLGKLWLRNNLKKQFGFFQFACNGLRADRVLATDSQSGERRRRGSAISHSFFTDRAFLLTRLQRLTKSETGLAKVDPSGPPRSRLSASLSKNNSASAEGEFSLAPRKRSAVAVASQALQPLARRQQIGDLQAPALANLRFAGGGGQGACKSTISIDFAKLTNVRTPLLSGVVFGSAAHWKKRCMERLGVCVNRTTPLTNRRFVNGGLETAPTPANLRFARASSAIALAAPAAGKNRDFTTFPLMMTKVPPLCLPSGLVTLISFPAQEYHPGKIEGFTSTRHCSRKRSKSKARSVSKPYLGVACSLLLRKTEQDRAGGRAEQREARQRSSTANLFGFNLDGTALVRTPLRGARSGAAAPLTNQSRPGGRFVQVGESSFQLTTQERLSILYSSNLDKISFLSSDLANLPLSLKTYTFLKKKGKKNMASLLKCSPNALFSLLNGDEKMFHEIQRCLLFLGLPFKKRF